MDEKQLRKAVAKELGLDDMPDSSWEVLKLRGHVDEALMIDEDTGKKDLVATARALQSYAEFMEGAPPRPRRKKRPAEEYSLELSGEEETRAIALGEHLAFEATFEPVVQKFRKEVLDDKLLTPDQAFSFIESPAACRFSKSWFDKWQVPIAGHTARWLDQEVFYRAERERYYESDYIFVDPPGHVFHSWLPEPFESWSDLPDLEFVEKSEGKLGKERLGRKLDDGFTKVTVYPDSVLGELRSVSKTLVDELDYSSWREGQAAWFLLTGDPVAPLVLVGEVFAGGSTREPRGTITLKAQPWIPVETVAKVYRNMQLYVLERTPRAPSARNIAIFGFVTRRLREALISSLNVEQMVPARPSWRELMEQWNKAHPEQSYSSYKNFNRDFHRAANILLSPIPGVDSLLELLQAIPEQDRTLL